MRTLESPLRAFTRKGNGMYNLNYWERLEKFKLLSMERRMERYCILYVWKSLYGFVPSLGFSWNNTVNRRGLQLTIKKVTGSVQSAVTLKYQSLSHYGVQLFNMLPYDLKIFQGTVKQFKSRLDKLLEYYPDQPYMDGYRPDARDSRDNPSNSLLDWIHIKGVPLITSEDTV